MISNIKMNIQSNLDSDIITSNLLTFDYVPTTTTTATTIIPTSQQQSSQPIPQPSKPPAQQNIIIHQKSPAPGLVAIEMQPNLNDNTRNAFECITKITATAAAGDVAHDNKVSQNVMNAEVFKDKSLLYRNKPNEKFIDNDHAYSQPFVPSAIVRGFDDHEMGDGDGGNSCDNNESGNALMDGVSDKIAPDHHARRPMNAFLIFCKRHRSIVREKYPNLENR